MPLQAPTFITLSLINLQSQNTKMLLRPVFGGPTSSFHGVRSGNGSLMTTSLESKNLRSRRKGSKFVASASKETAFLPFEEAQKESLVLPSNPNHSLSRHCFSEACEAAINEQINVEYNVSYAYHAMFAYFDRDNVALKGVAKFFKKSSEEERDHAEQFIKFQNIRGGKVRLHSLVAPISEFEHPEKGDALYAMELALSLEKLTNEKLLSLHRVATENNDPQMADFIESQFLTEQVVAIKNIAKYVAQLRRVGQGHGVWHFNQMLLQEN